MYLCQSINKKSYATLFKVNNVCDICFQVDYILVGRQKVYIIYAENELEVICQISTYMYYIGIDINTIYTFTGDYLDSYQISTYLDFDTEKVFIIGENSIACRNMSIKKY